MQVHPVAASLSVAPTLLRRPRVVTVTAVAGQAVYLRTTNPTSPAICLTTPNAVRVPCALVLGDGTPAPRARVGDTGLAGGGELVLRDVTYRPARWWRAPRPRTTRPSPVVQAPPLEDDDTAAAVADLADALGAEAALRGPVAALLGRGPGLTPLGDDILAGALVALLAAGSPAGPRLARQITAHAFARTTFVSAALLWHAARGECVPELAALLTGAPGAAEALLRVGHSSGAGLAHGVATARAAIRRSPMSQPTIDREVQA